MMSRVDGVVDPRSAPADRSRTSRSRSTSTGPGLRPHARVTYAGPRRPCCRASRSAACSRSRRSSTSSCRARRAPAQCRGCPQTVDRPAGRRPRPAGPGGRPPRGGDAGRDRPRTRSHGTLDIEAGVDGRSVGAVAADVESRSPRLSFPLEYHAEVLTDGDRRGDRPGPGPGLRRRRRDRGVAAAPGGVPQLAPGGPRLRAPPLGPGRRRGGRAHRRRRPELGALLGLLAVFGLAARSGMLLVATSCVFASARPGRSAVGARPTGCARAVGTGAHLRGGPRRCSPCLSSCSAPGRVWRSLHPLAQVLLGGLVTSTLVTLFVLPALYAQLAPGRRRRADDERRDRVSRRAVRRPRPGRQRRAGRARRGDDSMTGECARPSAAGLGRRWSSSSRGPSLTGCRQIEEASAARPPARDLDRGRRPGRASR